jgi:hypothetical protein
MVNNMLIVNVLGYSNLNSPVKVRVKLSLVLNFVSHHENVSCA